MPNNYYYNLRRLLASLVRIQFFKDGELLAKFLLPSVQAMAEIICDKYFPKEKAGNLAIREDLLRLITLYLILAPILQRERHAFKIDCHRGHLLSAIRRVANSRVRRFHIRVIEMERTRDLDLLHRNLVLMGINDEQLFSTVIQDVFRTHYTAGFARGRLANALFDGIMFLGESNGNSLRVGNRFVRMESEPFDGAIDLRENFALVWDYQIRYVKTKSGGKIDILISEARIKVFRDRVKNILRTQTTPAYRVVMIERAIRDFIEDAKFAKSAFPQILEISRWLKQKIRSLSGTERSAHALPNLIVDLFRTRSSDRYFANRPNFFWDAGRVTESVFINFFSPYREWL